MGFQTQYERLLAWARKAEQQGWLNASDLIPLEHIERQQVDLLFRKQNHRPLIVALFGGTGVGKSSLLNRLAGEQVAKTGVERPTSHEVTLYLHKDFQLDMLPEELPTQETRIAYHDQGSRRLVAWLDMPDIDSTATHNQEIVQAWLPYVDWVIYVVSPDRYYDDIGWRFLQQRAHRHAWLFVINHWDEGRPEQLEDFRQRLRDEGFIDPIVLRTSCVEPPIEDDFPQLEQTINQAIEKYGLDILQRLGVEARIDDLYKSAEQFIERLGSDAQWQKMQSRWDELVRRRISDISNQMNTSLAALSQSFTPPRMGGQRVWLQRLIGKDHDANHTTALPPALDNQHIVERLWDERAETRVTALNEQLVNELQTAQLPYPPVEQSLEQIIAKERSIVRRALEDHVNAALANPGTHLQRSAYRWLGWLSWGLPVAAILWAITHVLQRFYQGTHGQAEFLGFNFVINAGLLVLLAWLLPWLLRMKVKPSLASAMRSGLEKGIQQAMVELQAEYQTRWRQLQQERRHYLDELQTIYADIQQLKLQPLDELGGIFVRKEPTA